MKIINNKIIVILLFILLPFINQAQSKKDSVHIQIQGKWAWTKTVPTAKGGIRGGIKRQKTTPLTCKCERTLTITDDKIISHMASNDSLPMSSYEYRNGTQESSHYSLRELVFLKDPKLIMIDSNILAGEVDIYRDTSMVVSYWVEDGGGTDYYFKKIK